MLDLEPIRARVARATEGAWQYKRYPPECKSDMGDVRSYTPGKEYLIAADCYGRDGALVAGAKTDILALVEEVERLRGVLAPFGAMQAEGCPDEVEVYVPVKARWIRRARALLTPAEAKPDA